MNFVINLKKRPDRLAEFKKIELPFDIKVIEAFEGGALGCIKSHLFCYEQFDADSINIVFEDDIVQINPLDIFYKAVSELPAWDMLYLGGMVHKPLKEYSEHTDKAWWVWTTHAVAYNGTAVSDYVLTYTAQEIFNSRRNIDTFLVHAVQSNPMFKTFITNPQIFIQADNYSDILNDQRDYKWKYKEEHSNRPQKNIE